MTHLPPELLVVGHTASEQSHTDRPISISSHPPARPIRNHSRPLIIRPLAYVMITMGPTMKDDAMDEASSPSNLSSPSRIGDSRNPHFLRYELILYKSLLGQFPDWI
jgi:hypothetical protein